MSTIQQEILTLRKTLRKYEHHYYLLDDPLS